MLTFRKILVKLQEKISEAMPDTNIETKNIDEGYERKCIYIYFDNVKASDYMKKFRETNLTVRIVYFPLDEDDYIEDLLTVQDKLIELFSDNNTIELDEGLFTEAQEVQMNIVDKTLLFNFDMYIFEDYPEKKYEMIEELNIKIGGIE